MNMSDYQELLYAVEDRIAHITLNVPDKRNALSYRMRDELIVALKRAESDDDVSVVLVDGARPSFCSGYDLTPREKDYQKDGMVHSAHFDNWTDPFARSCVRDWLVMGPVETGRGPDTRSLHCGRDRNSVDGGHRVCRG